MMQRTKHACLIMVGMLLLLGGFAEHVSAASPVASSPDGLGVTPALVTLSVGVHDDEMSYQNTVSNDSDNPVRITARSSDFTMTGANGEVLFTANQAEHGLAEHMTISPESFVIAPHQSRAVTITITNANGLNTGGHYGAVLYKVANATTGTTNSSKVTVHKTVASLVFVTTAGQGTYSLQLLPIDHPIALFHLPTSYSLTFRNSGNTQVVPQGYVQVSGFNSTLHSRGSVNVNSALVLPGTDRLINVPVTRVSHAWLPGRYTVTVNYRYVGATGYQQKTTSFWYINFGSIVCILIVFMITRAWWKRHGGTVKNRILSTIHRTTR